METNWGARRNESAIEKLPVTTSIAVTKLGLAGDEQADVIHGGAGQALYAYAREDLDWWSERLNRPLRDGMFGENLTLRGFDVSGALLAERWRIGNVLAEVTAPRMACGTFGAWMREKQWGPTFNATRRPGAYLRVLEEGELSPGDGVEVVWRPDEHVTVAEGVAGILGDEDVLRRIAVLSKQVPEWDFEAVMLHAWRRAKSAARRKQEALSGTGGEKTHA
ncbi:MOSC domain-containing protein [Saccharopolyspora taberi]|uniref:MOSC domain-containing protein n=1 Tax=Saccharopolyspora taberi TaxID=60895 RepID=A0ABN3V6E0_9PSEU